MRIARVKTEKWHRYSEGDCGHPIKVGCYYKKGFWKRYDRKKYLKKILNYEMNIAA
jgi:hypothetical protein